MKYIKEKAKAQLFMKQLCKNFSDQKRAFILVLHIVPSSIPLIQSLGTIGRIAGIIAKPNSIDNDTYNFLKNKYNFLPLKKKDFLQQNIIQEKICPYIQDSEKCIIIDIGGYFANTLNQLNNFQNLMGIVEDTENGLQKYENIQKRYKNDHIPIFSIARSRSKDFEDYLVGRSIAESTITVLRQNNIPYKTKKVGIIGFGEVGRGCAFYLRDCEKLKIHIYDKNKEVQEFIRKRGFLSTERNELITQSDIIICATGNKSISDFDIPFLKPHCFISSCTSRDDEFDFHTLKISECSKSGKWLSDFGNIHFINECNAVNFIFPSKQISMLSPYIYLTHSALILAASILDKKDIYDNNKIHTIPIEMERELISKFRKQVCSDSKNTIFINKILKQKLGREI